MNEANSDAGARICCNCGKNLKVLNKDLIVESAGMKFCSFDCAELRGHKLKRPKKRSYR